ncbi:MAG TPA: thiol:disulfide interchange protein DsbA/DsbL [Telluria sp.]
MRSLRFALVAASLVVSTAFASPADPKSGVDYMTLAQPQPTQAVGKKVEVIEFFMYHCPHCNVLEPALAQWVKKQGDNINFKRIHMPYRGPNDPEAHLYLTLEAMGKLDELNPKIFKAIHVDRVRPDSDQAVIDLAVKNGVDRAKFMETWNSFGVTTKLRRLPAIMGAYKVESVPTVVVDGKYMTSPAVAGQAAGATTSAQAEQALLQVLDALVAKSKAKTVNTK